MIGLGPVAAAGALILVLVGLDRLAGRVIRVDAKPVERSVADTGIEHEEVLIDSDGRKLAAWLLTPGDAQPSEPLLLMAHGWSANHGTVLPMAEPLARRGHDVLLFDVRGHGYNAPTPFVSIRDFRDDLMAAARYAARRFPDRQLVLVGHSLGAAAGVVAAADGAPFDGLVLIAAPSDILTVTAEFLDEQGMPGDLLMTVLRPFLWRRVGGSFRPLTPSRRIRELDIPVLMIQPENDTRVVRAHAERLAAAGRIEFRIVAGREHTDVLSAPETLALIEDFVESV